MPSTFVHVGFAGLLGVALLSDRFDARAILAVMAVAAFPDLDTFVGLWLMDGAHRTVLHNLVLPAIVLSVLLWDVHLREESYVTERWGARGYRVAWVSVVGGWLVAHVFLDAFFNGVNLLWPFYDQFIDLSGRMIVSDQRGFVQTFIEFEWTADGGTSVAPEHTRGSSRDSHYYTGVDPGPDAAEDVERWLPIADSGPLFVLMVTGYAAVAYRLVEGRLARDR